jgi:subfamily B ATP-binding cassette protein MsbA
MKQNNALKILFPLLKFYPWGIPAIVTLGILASLSEGLGISLFIPFLQTLSQDPSQPATNSLVGFLNNLFTPIPASYRLVVIPLCIFSTVLLKNFLAYSNTIVFSWLNSRISHRLRSDIFKQLLTVSYQFLETQESGKLLNTLASETWQTSKALSVLVGILINICTIFVFVILLLLISWKLTILVGFIMIFISLFIHLFTRRIKYLGQQAVEANADLGVRMWEGLTGMRVIRAFNQELYEQNRFDRTSKQVRNIFIKLDVISGIVGPLSETLSALVLLCILAIALHQRQASLPSLLTFMFILYRVQPQVQQLDSSRVYLLSLTSSVQEVMSFIDPSDKPYIKSGDQKFAGLQQGIAFESVTFHYNLSEKPALNDISIYIPKGKTTALVGPSGAGKSTIINLICRFYEVSEGDIYVDSYPLRKLKLADWRSQIAIVSQDIHVFSTTIRENIAYGRLDATFEEIIEAAKLANADEFIQQLPEGYDTPVGDQGVRLSGGQRQRIALARAIIRNPEILILDEATNALDSISEHLIQEAINTLSQNRTVIVIAHRLSTIEKADQIIVMKQGKVVEKGDLQNLLKLNGLFSKLYSLQHQSLSE